MSRSPFLRVVWCGILAAGVSALTNCAAPTEAPVRPNFARAAAGPAVTAADPSFGHQGDANKVVTITGSGFVAGSQPAWEQNGQAYQGIQVVSTQFVSSTQLVATLNIAAGATIDVYDISVTNPDRKKGIGYSLFQVTQAIAVTGTGILRGTNSRGEMVGVLTQSTGNLAYYYSLGTGLVELYNNGAGWAIDEAGKTISGNTAGGGGLPIPLWNLSGGSWIQGALPVDPKASGGVGRAMASDGTGTGIYIAGMEAINNGRKNSGTQVPVIWRSNLSGAWEEVQLPSLSTSGQNEVRAVSPSGVGVGTSNGHAVVWTPNGSGGYSISTLPGAANGAYGINSAGTLIVGSWNQSAAYYWQSLGNGAWSDAQSLPIACGWAAGVDDAGRIVANACPRSSRVMLSAVFTPPYATTPPIWLGGLDPSTAPVVWGMSLQNGWIVGQAALKGNAGVGAYWKIP